MAKGIDIPEIPGKEKPGVSDPANPSLKQLNRRDLGKAALAGALGATQLAWLPSGFAQEQTGSATARLQSSGLRPGINLSLICPANATDEDFLFYKQMGADAVRIRSDPNQDYTVEGMLELKKRFADAGIVIDKIDTPVVDLVLHDIVLNGSGRDKAIEDYKAYIHRLAAGGFYYIPQMFSVPGLMTSGFAEERGARVRAFDSNSSEIMGQNPNMKSVKGPANALLYGREYSTDEIWENYKYFIRQVAPVLVETGVRIGLHPDDPPTPSMFGVPHILANFEDYKKALKVANCPNVGVLLCCGAWEEGGEAMGIDIPGAIRYFASQKKLFEIHFRNVSSPLPQIHQTYLDHGYYDMYKIMKALVEVKYDGVVTLENTVEMVGGSRASEAFGIGYTRAMLQRAQAENSA